MRRRKDMDRIQSPILTRQLLMNFGGGVFPDVAGLAYMCHSCIGNPVEWVVYRMAAWAEDYHG